MAEKQEMEQESFIQKWAPHLVAGVLVVAIGFYLSQFQGGLSSKQSNWGLFGDFVGGAVNPIIGFFTIWLLAVSLRQNHKALDHANQALDQAKAELKLTRESIEQTGAIQAATESALRQQIEIAAHARDMNNAVAIHEHHTRTYEKLYLKRSKGTAEAQDQIAINLAHVEVRTNQMERILEQERLRLIASYDNESSQK